MNQLGTFRREAHVPVNTDKIVGHSRWLGERRDLIRRKHSSIRTEQAYLEWAKRFILFHGKRHPKDMGAQEIVAFLTDPAVARNVAASTQNQALNALVFLYKPGYVSRTVSDAQRGMSVEHLRFTISVLSVCGASGRVSTRLKRYAMRTLLGLGLESRGVADEGDFSTG